MRLLRLEEGDNVSLTDDLTHDIPPYAILSHTWGERGEEVTFQDLQNKVFQQKPGYGKILFCGRQAQLDGLDYFWVDTCCIDKTSAAELAESINSMYFWYKNAKKCYVYLSDMLINLDRNTPPLLSSWLHGFQNSRWFQRGWTLQELVAPQAVEFFSSNGQKLGDKASLEDPLHEITNVPILSLRSFSQSNIDLKTIFSWCQNRETTWPEDKVYSILGLAGVSMPVIYGEGEGTAFLRLCAEALQRNPRTGQSLLMFVTEIGHAPALRILVRGKENIESKDNDGNSLLALAASNGHKAAVKMLLDEGADIESKNNSGNSPLAIAATQGHEAAIHVLLDKGANVESESLLGSSPLVLAAHRGHKTTVRMLLDKGADIESKKNHGQSPLSWAAVGGHEAIIRLLLDKGANIESKNSDGWSPLALAAWKGHVGIIQLLLGKGANIESKNSNGYSPLVLAALNGHEEATQVLLGEGADIESKSNNGHSPLAIAASNGHEVAIRILLDKGADIESRSNNGDSPLAVAASHGQEAAIRVLLDKGAKIESYMLSWLAIVPRQRIKELLESERLKRATHNPVKKLLESRTKRLFGFEKSNNG